MRFWRHVPALLTLLLATGAYAADAGSLTLEQALGTAEGVNLNVLLAREASAQALEQVNQLRSGILPNISVIAQERRTDTVNIAASATTTSGGVIVPYGQAVPGVVTTRFDGKFSGSYSLLNPQLMAAVRSARVGVQVSQADYRATLELVLASVADSYFTHLRNLRRLTVLDANIERARVLQNLAQTQLTAGVVTKIDLTRAEAALAQAEQARLQQVTAVYQSELLLKRLLDIDPTRALKLEDFTVRQVDTKTGTVDDPQTTFGQRSDWVRTQKSVEQSKLDVRTARFERLPILALGAEYGFSSGDFNDNVRRSAWFAGATVSVPVFDGMKASADRRAALSRQRAQEARLQNIEQQISSEVLLARQDASSRNAQVAVAETNLHLAEEQLRLAQVRYQQGVADNLEVVDAQNQLAVASDNLVDAVYQYNLSRVELARAKGDVRAVLADKAT